MRRYNWNLSLGYVSIMVVVYFFKEVSTLDSLAGWLGFWLLFLLYIWFNIALINFKKFLSGDEIDGYVKEVKEAREIYPFMFIVGLPLLIDSVSVFVFMFVAMLVLTYYSRIYVYNPFYYIMGYRIFKVTTANDYRITIISKDLRPDKFGEPIYLKRINDETFIESK